MAEHMREHGPMLWYPDAASRWSLIFTPAFGAWIHAKNWIALGNEVEAKRAIACFYFSLALVLWVLIFLPIDLVIASVLLMAGIWHFEFAKSQIAYVNKEIGEHYEKRSWRRPLSVAIGCFILFVIFKFILASVACR